MALLFMDSFDHYATADITEKWTTQSSYDRTIASGGRNSTNCLKFTGAGWVSITCLGGVSEAIVGVAVKVAAFDTGCPLVEFGSVSTWECGLTVLADGTLQPFVVNNISHEAGYNTFRTLIGSPTVVALQTGVWAYLEVQMKCDGSTGTCVVKLNGLEVLNLTGLDTLFTSASLTRVALASYNNNLNAFDDLVIMDLTGAANNSFLGDVTISAILPNGAGNSSGWTPSAGNNYDCVNEASPNDDTDYNATSTLNAKDLYAFADAPAGADIRAVQVLASVRKAAEGPGQVKLVTRSNSTDYDGAEKGIGGTTYAYVREVLETNPATAAAWTESGFNAAEFGIKKTA